MSFVFLFLLNMHMKPRLSLPLSNCFILVLIDIPPLCFFINLLNLVRFIYLFILRSYSNSCINFFMFYIDELYFKKIFSFK
jgi:hypothetical protein